ncbi:hypothetical protein CPB86DRAFT_739690 [Serendipita vermifera]|nr:hypothetical protein CPB86DRAFT_739690 [Serendipita vermifera]
MSDRETLIAMGFSPERVDWAIRDTPPASDMQTRLDHIIDNENRPVPVANQSISNNPLIQTPTETALPIRFAPPAHPPPRQNSSQSQQFNAPSNPSAQVPPGEVLTRGMGSLSLSAGPPTPSTYKVAQKSELVNQAVQRYSAFLESHQNALEGSVPGKETVDAFDAALVTFLDAERTHWRAHFGIPREEIVPPIEYTSTRGTIASEQNPSGSTDVPAPQDKKDADTAPPVAPPVVKSVVYDSIAVYDPNRGRIPPSPALAQVLNKVITAYYEDEPVENAVKRARSIRPKISDQISAMKLSAEIATNRDDEEAHKARGSRSEDYYARRNEYFSQGDWKGAESIAQEYQMNEIIIRQQESRKKYETYCGSFVEPAQRQINAAFSEIYPIYNEIQGYLQEDNGELDVVRAVLALEEVSDMMELGMKQLETLEDDKNERECELQKEQILDDKNRSNAYEDSRQLGQQKRLRDLDINTYRTGQKVERRAPFYALAMRRMGDAIASVDRDAMILTSSLHELLATVPPSLPLPQEEERKVAGDDAPSKVPLPSRELYDQISSAKSSLSSIYEMQENMRDVLKNLQRKQIYERRESETAQLALNESRAGRGDMWYWDAGRVKREEDEKEDNAYDLEFNRMKSERKTTFNEGINPASAVMKAYTDRETLVLSKVASGVRADGSMVTNPADSAAASAALTQQTILQHQQAIMMSNMMWSQHIGTINVIRNMGMNFADLV